MEEKVRSLEAHIHNLRDALSALPKDSKDADFQSRLMALHKARQPVMLEMAGYAMNSRLFDEVIALLNGIIRRLEPHKDEPLTKDNCAGRCYHVAVQRLYNIRGLQEQRRLHAKSLGEIEGIGSQDILDRELSDKDRGAMGLDNDSENDSGKHKNGRSR